MTNYIDKVIKQAKTERMIARLIEHSMNAIGWDEDSLTIFEKTIIHNNQDFIDLNIWVEERLL